MRDISVAYTPAKTIQEVIKSFLFSSSRLLALSKVAARGVDLHLLGMEIRGTGMSLTGDERDMREVWACVINREFRSQRYYGHSSSSLLEEIVILSTASYISEINLDTKLYSLCIFEMHLDILSLSQSARTIPTFSASGEGDLCGRSRHMVLDRSCTRWVPTIGMQGRLAAWKLGLTANGSYWNSIGVAFWHHVRAGLARGNLKTSARQ